MHWLRGINNDSLVYVLDLPRYQENGDLPLVLGLHGQNTGRYFTSDDHANANHVLMRSQSKNLQIFTMKTKNFYSLKLKLNNKINKIKNMKKDNKMYIVFNQSNLFTFFSIKSEILNQLLFISLFYLFKRVLKSFFKHLLKHVLFLLFSFLFRL